MVPRAFALALPFVLSACLRLFFAEVIDPLSMLLPEAPALALPFWFDIAPLVLFEVPVEFVCAKAAEDAKTNAAATINRFDLIVYALLGGIGKTPWRASRCEPPRFIAVPRSTVRDSRAALLGGGPRLGKPESRLGRFTTRDRIGSWLPKLFRLRLNLR
jgi:hypothetical protein